MSVWEPDLGLKEDGTPYLRAKTVDDEVRLAIEAFTDTRTSTSDLSYLQPFRNNDPSPASSDASLHFPISAFADPEAVPEPLPLDATISTPYATLYAFLEDAERGQQKVRGPSRLGHVRKLP